jgi:hypothetical protein
MQSVDPNFPSWSLELVLHNDWVRKKLGTRAISPIKILLQSPPESGIREILMLGRYTAAAQIRPLTPDLPSQK